jgi:hypothetical protein
MTLSTVPLLVSAAPRAAGLVPAAAGVGGDHDTQLRAKALGRIGDGCKRCRQQGSGIAQPVAACRVLFAWIVFMSVSVVMCLLVCLASKGLLTWGA